MSELQKTIMKSKLPPRCPKSASGKLAPFGMARRKDYSPVPWQQYFEKYVDVETESGRFRVYLSPEPDHSSRPRLVTLHGGGYSGLSWALFTEEITNMIHCQVISMDIRGHGETQADNPDDLSADTLVKDVEQVLHKLFGEELPPIVLVGHSMGGAVAVRAALLPSLEPYVHGIAVIDVVEGTAMDALASMQSFLRGRPTHFRSIEHAVEWCVRSGQVRNVDSAKVSMPSQIVNVETNLLATNELATRTAEAPQLPAPMALARAADCIAEEPEHADADADADADYTPPPTAPPTPPTRGDGDTNMRYKWRIDLSKTERYWSGWFQGLSGRFLSVRAPRLLLLASIEGLDRELTIGQMQGKFQMQVLTRCGHAVHEDTPGEVARVIALFLLRHRVTEATEAGEALHLASTPGC
ncbi:protein phosphatase methylesterase 1 [Cydia amplana]|uniref:protein phosphatase methylesterase 1 n=1 Tax=Cydia amplana TaxID=1869771 RepID=UPI002FE5AC6F